MSVEDSRGVSVAELFAEVSASVADVFAEIEWAESEIAAAQQRWPDSADELFHSFAVIARPDGVVGTECVYRAYARELLDRIGRGEDLRPGTAVEVCMGLRGASLRAPLNHEGFGLYARMWEAAGLPAITELADMRGHYEAISGDAINAAETDARRACARPDRVAVVPECMGRHHGEPVACRYANGAGA